MASVENAVVSNAEAMAAGLQVGCICFNNAALPAMWGVAILVPLMYANRCPTMIYPTTQDPQI